MKYYLQLTVSILTILFWLAASAIAGEWTVSRVTGPAVYTMDGKTWGKVKLGLNLPNAAWVNTGPQGKVQLKRGNDTIYIGSYSLVSAYKKSVQRTQVRQDFGTVTIDVQKRNYDHMGVETPFMAAIVKGTKFTVSSSRIDSRLSVSRGQVEVSDRRSGATSDVNSGESVTLDQRPSTAIAVESTLGSRIQARLGKKEKAKKQNTKNPKNAKKSKGSKSKDSKAKGSKSKGSKSKGSKNKGSKGKGHGKGSGGKHK